MGIAKRQRGSLARKRREKLKNTKFSMGIVRKVAGLITIMMVLALPLTLFGGGVQDTLAMLAGFCLFLVFSVVVLTPILTLLGLSADAVEAGVDHIGQKRIIATREKHPIAGAISIATDQGDLSEVDGDRAGAIAELDDR